MRTKTDWKNAKEIFFKNKRFDLIFKYLYLKNKDKNISFFKDLYLEHIRAFNNFYEECPSDGISKNSPEDFLNSFDKIFNNIKENGFDEKTSHIPVDQNLELGDGAHRLTACAYLNKDVAIKKCKSDRYYDYVFFKNKKIEPFYADYAALEYVKLNPNAYIVNLHSVTDKKFDNQVIDILNKYGFVFYQKDVFLTLNGYVNLKKMSYGSDIWNKESWVGDVKNSFAGAKAHAKKSMGKNPLRAFVFVCDDLQKVIKVKAEIRAIYNIGNYSVHINDTREEAIMLAQTYFNENSLKIINSRPFDYEEKEFDSLVNELKNAIVEENLNVDDFCACGSTPFGVLGIRKIGDFDFFEHDESYLNFCNDKISKNDSQLKYYPYSKEEIIYNPKNYFYYKGLKFINLDVLYKMKEKRGEIPKDVNDCKLIKLFNKQKLKLGGKEGWKLFKKVKNGNKRKIYLLGVKVFCYKRNKGYIQRLPYQKRIGDRYISSKQLGSDTIYNTLITGKPCLITRFGNTEFKAINYFCENIEGQDINYPPSIKDEMRDASGFFSNTDDLLTKFCCDELNILKNVDVFAPWVHTIQANEIKVINEYAPNAKLVHLSSLMEDLFFMKKPWTRYLKGKKVLVIHPFEETIKEQYKKRDKLFENKEILPDFELKTIKAVQGLGSAEETNKFSNWFEALESMYRQIDETDFDVALIGAGAYGMFLANYVKEKGKQAVHVAGALQLLFGIKGSRWIEKFSKQYKNSNWIYPLDEDTITQPEAHIKVEGNSAYWR
ncbi:MAG: hypothetical protein R3Y43_02665 [Alphaproteobacteria bacterium]